VAPQTLSYKTKEGDQPWNQGRLDNAIKNLVPSFKTNYERVLGLLKYNMMTIGECLKTIYDNSK
jgi:hypothetical protein